MQTISISPPSLLATQVQGAFEKLGYRQLRSLHCQTYGGTVTLHGTIGSFYLKQIAQSTAAKVPGVERVINEIKVLE
jgi:osmotically-inducible protein OsmY